jgi:phosphoenolpyruvate carboxykinase (ATP)
MNNLLNIETPAEKQAQELKSDYDLRNHGITNLRKAYWNLPTEALYEEVIFRNEGKLTHLGPIVVNTGEHTARAANDKFVVFEAGTEEHVWWGQYNRPIETEIFEALFARLQGFLQGRDLFIQDCFAGADLNYKLPIRIITEHAWHSIFARNMFILPETNEAYRRHVPQFTVFAIPSFQAYPSIDGSPTKTFIALSFEKGLCIIGNTAYAGEIKKSIFSVLNYLLPLQNVMTMHCSANVGDQGDVALFFGLSGTGKTTLSADPERKLIGDDEHGWSDDGVFNFEAGSYAKVIQLSSSAEPQIYACTRKFGTILENVVFDPLTRLIDLDDESITENTRASYPLEFIENSVAEKKAGHPSNIILLTCDASGVMPPIARLNTNQALYHFISGYTSKVAGTEIGLGQEPEITFSACFGAPFMVLHPQEYADLLRNKIERFGVTCWLLNTGWVGGPYGIGKRISIKFTRTMLKSALSGALSGVSYTRDKVFGFEVPDHCPDVPDDVLNPSLAWPSKKEYHTRYHDLAARFIDNFRKFEDQCDSEIKSSGPRI